MINTIKGVIAKIYPKESGTGKYGAWTKQSFVIEFRDGDKDRELHLTCMKPDILKGFGEGETVTVNYKVDSREYNNRYYHNVNCIKIS